jgi:hypothetical protein
MSLRRVVGQPAEIAHPLSIDLLLPAVVLDRERFRVSISEPAESPAANVRVQNAS